MAARPKEEWVRRLNPKNVSIDELQPIGKCPAGGSLICRQLVLLASRGVPCQRSPPSCITCAGWLATVLFWVASELF